MKNIWIIVLLILSLLACSEDDEALNPQANLKQYGEANLLLNGQALTFYPIIGPSNCEAGRLTGNLSYYDANNVRRIYISLGNFPAKEGNYTLKWRESGQNESATKLIYSNLHLTEDDVSSPAFRIIEEEGPNELIIIHYDSVAQRIEGRFQMTATINTTEEDRNREDRALDTLRITYGTFTADILPPQE